MSKAINLFLILIVFGSCKNISTENESLGRAGRTLGLLTEPPIFAWIIITTGNRTGYCNGKMNRIGQG
ncbi:hypothetical protein [Aquiflexum sp.]|uniref:hypothetical protein n=1 Tax=Aquiflexum sp. TaxID=1872584 RepID=UPI0035938687